MPEDRELSKRDKCSELAATVDDLDESLVWGRDVGDVLAEVLTSNGRAMTDLEAAVVAALRSRLIEHTDGWKVLPSLPWLQLGFDHLAESNWLAVEEFLGLVTSTRVRARLGDVLWEKRLGKSPHESAAIALEAHSEIASDERRRVAERESSVRRGLTLAQMRKEPDVLDSLVGAGTRLVDMMITSKDDYRVHAVSLICRIESTGIWGPAQEETLALVLDRVDDPWALRQLGSVLVSHGRSQVDAFDPAIKAFQDHANQQSNMILKWTSLLEAVRLARSVGHPERSALLRELQQINPMEEAPVLRAGHEISFGEISSVTMAIVDSDSLALAFRRIAELSIFPSSEKRMVYRQELVNRPKLHTLFSRVRIGESGSVVEQATDEDAKLDWVVRESFVRYMREDAYLYVAAAFHKAVTAYGSQDVDGALLELGLVDNYSRAATVQAIDSFVDERYHASASTVAPVVERAVRTIACEHGIAVTRPPTGNKKGGVKQLAELLNQLGHQDDCSLQESTLWSLKAITTSTAGGLNLRNEISHATLEDPASPADAALLLFCLLRLVSEHQSS